MCKQYFVEIDTADGKKPVEVSKEVWELFEEERKAAERERYERRKHLDVSVSPEDAALSVSKDFDTLQAVREVLQTCTPIQRERFYLNRICGYSFTEIARMQNCRHSSVIRSIQQVMKKIKKIF